MGTDWVAATWVRLVGAPTTAPTSGPWDGEVILSPDGAPSDSGNNRSVNRLRQGQMPLTFRLYSSSSSEKMFGLNEGSGPTGKSSLSSVITSVICRGCRCSSEVL